MRRSGEAALARATKVLEACLTSGDPNAMRVAEDFFGLSDIVRADSRLRRSLTDPARSTEDKRALATTAFGAKVQPATLEVLGDLVDSHWADPMDLHDAAEVLGIVATMEDARRNDALARMGEELFGLMDLIGAQRELRMRLSDMGPGSAHERAELAQRLFEPRLSAWTMRLLRRAVARTSHGRLIATLRRYAERVAALQDRVLVSVESAAEMTPAQSERLGRILARRLGREVSLTVSVVPGLIGGFRLRTGTTALDSSVQTQVDHLRRAIVG